jgi:DNA-binding transcriptional regulator YdaS (Cro superfamily)
MSDTFAMNVQTIIERAGGVGKLAALLGVSHPTVSDWKRTGSIPGGRVVQISSALGLSVDEVIKLVPSPRSRTDAA